MVVKLLGAYMLQQLATDAVNRITTKRRHRVIGVGAPSLFSASIGSESAVATLMRIMQFVRSAVLLVHNSSDSSF